MALLEGAPGSCLPLLFPPRFINRWSPVPQASVAVTQADDASCCPQRLLADSCPSRLPNISAKSLGTNQGLRCRMARAPGREVGPGPRIRLPVPALPAPHGVTNPQRNPARSGPGYKTLHQMASCVPFLL